MTNLQNIILGIALILGFDIYTKFECHETKKSTNLRFVSALFRHGERSVDTGISESYPNDPHKDYDYYPEGGGQLTIVGKKRAYQLGVTLRNRYDKFLGKYYYQPNVYARSTALTRTKMTLQLVLAGLYPPYEIQKWSPIVFWQPTNFIFENEKASDFLLFSFLCPVYVRRYRDMLQNNSEVKARVAEYADLIKEVSKHTGKNVTSLYGLMLIYSTLTAESLFGLSLPEWTKSIYPKGKLLNATILQYDLFCHKSINRLFGGILLRRIRNDMDAVINRSLIDRKINLLSAHDVNVAALLYALNIFDSQVPQFTSSVIIELHEKNGEFFVKVIYYLGNPAKMIEKRIPGCELLCPYNKFIDLTDNITATNEELICPEQMESTFDIFL